MNFVSKKYLMSALLVCASIGNGFTNPYNPYDKYFNGITDTYQLSNTKDALQEENDKKYQSILDKCFEQLDQLDDYNERSKIYDLQYKIYNEKYKENNLIYDAYNKALKNIDETKTTSIADKVTDVVSTMSQYKDTVHFFIPKLSDYNKANDEYLANMNTNSNISFGVTSNANDYITNANNISYYTTNYSRSSTNNSSYTGNNNFSISKVAQYSFNNSIADFDELTPVSKISNSNTYINNNASRTSNSVGVTTKTTQTNDSVDANPLHQVAYNKPVDVMSLQKTNINGDAAQPIAINSSEIKTDAINNTNSNVNFPETNNDSEAAPVLDNNSKPVKIDTDERVNKQVDEEKVNNNKEKASNNETNEYIAKFEDCKNEEDLTKVKETLKKENEKQKSQIYDEYYKRYNQISNDCDKKRSKFNNIDEQLKLSDMEMEDKNAARKKRDDLLKQNYEESKKINEAYDKVFNDLWNRSYNELLKETKDNDNYYETLLKINNHCFYSINKDQIKEFINLQNAVKNVVEKEAENSKFVKPYENIKEIYSIMKASTEQEIRQLSMLYYQIHLILSGEIDSLDKINQSFDLNDLYYLLFDYNDKLTLDASYYTSDLNKELLLAVIHDYFVSKLDVNDYIKTIQKNKESIISQYREKIYKPRINKIFDNKIKNKETSEYLKETYIEEKNKYLKMLDDENINQKEWDNTINKLIEGKYLESINIWINTTLKLNEMKAKLQKSK